MTLNDVNRIATAEDSGAVEMLKIVAQGRNWHKNKLGPAKVAGQIKTNLIRNRVSHKKCTEILKLLGYVVTQREQWIHGDLLD